MMSKTRFSHSVAVVLAVLATGVSAQTSHDHGAEQTGHEMQLNLSEPGQGAFAAVSEVVALLRSDPNTDWVTVDIDGLRQHLVDMDNLMTLSEVQTSEIANGLELRVSRVGKGGVAAERMVPAHAPVLASATGWTSTVSRSAEEIIWRVSDPKGTAVIRALGFYGLMTVGDHHREHHLGIAKGELVH